MNPYEYLVRLKKKYAFIKRQSVGDEHYNGDSTLGDQLGIVDGEVKKQLPKNLIKKGEWNKYYGQKD
jgi:hypothetical protein